jgi:hypothetical protein
MILEYISKVKKVNTQQIFEYLLLNCKDTVVRKTIVRDLNYLKQIYTANKNLLPIPYFYGSYLYLDILL